jgi:hypothetical protein
VNGSRFLRNRGWEASGGANLGANLQETAPLESPNRLAPCLYVGSSNTVYVCDREAGVTRHDGVLEAWWLCESACQYRR